MAGLQRLATATTARVPSCSVEDIVSFLVEEDPATLGVKRRNCIDILHAHIQLAIDLKKVGNIFVIE